MISVAVNVANRQLADPGFPDLVREALVASGAPAEVLCLEIVEQALAEDGRTARLVIDDLKLLGPLKVCIDDFGTGHSSLARLKGFPVDGLKIDRSFVSDLGLGTVDRAIVQAIVDLGHTLGLQIVAEGVETHEQLDALRQIGCDLAQGWLFAPALPAGEIDALVAMASTAFSSVVSGVRPIDVTALPQGTAAD